MQCTVALSHHNVTWSHCHTWARLKDIEVVKNVINAKYEGISVTPQVHANCPSPAPCYPRYHFAKAAKTVEKQWEKCTQQTD